MFERQNKEMRSLNVELPALYVEELELRLETDPIAVGGLMGRMADVDVDSSNRMSCDQYCDVYCEDNCTSKCGQYCASKCGLHR